ncbi:hypothetical protein BHE74_00043331 [Ensete ventricosum]|nr:hypothetical protein GW17_00003745 [Ensete ventricosum]RWW50404.1 hypothetical protein BHE74_00043331 [Ensete ventricosum]
MTLSKSSCSSATSVPGKQEQSTSVHCEELRLAPCWRHVIAGCSTRAEWPRFRFPPGGSSLRPSLLTRHREKRQGDASKKD